MKPAPATSALSTQGETGSSRTSRSAILRGLSFSARASCMRQVAGEIAVRGLARAFEMNLGHGTRVPGATLASAARSRSARWVLISMGSEDIAADYNAHDSGFECIEYVMARRGATAKSAPGALGLHSPGV